MTRKNSAASRAARHTARTTGVSYTAALYAGRDAAMRTERLELAGWGPNGETLVSVATVRTDTTYQLSSTLMPSGPSSVGSATGRQLLAQPRLSCSLSGDGPFVDVRPLVDFDTQRAEYGVKVTLGTVRFWPGSDMWCILGCDGCPFHACAAGLASALEFAREHNDQHVEFPGDWGFELSADGKWRRTRS